MKKEEQKELQEIFDTLQKTVERIIIVGMGKRKYEKQFNYILSVLGMAMGGLDSIIKEEAKKTV